MKLPSNMKILERKPRPGALRALTLQASTFSLQYHYLIKHKGYENKGNDYQR